MWGHRKPNSFRMLSNSHDRAPSSAIRCRQEYQAAFEALEPRVVLSAERIVTIGDSWAWLVANGAPGSTVNQAGFGNSLQNVLNTFHPGVTAANESFMGGTAAQMATMLPSITDRINAHPDADIVWLSIGGNDMLAGALGGGYTNLLTAEQKSALYATITGNVETVVNHILSLRPNIQIMIEGYDAINVWDLPSGTASNNVRANLGIIKSGNVIVDAQQNQQLNQGFLDLENSIANIATNNRRVAFVNNWGLNHTMVGYSGYFGNFPAIGTFPPDFYPYLPTPTSRMNSGDPIHLNTAGYTNIALNAQINFLSTALQAGQLGLSTSTLDFGQVRLGTSASLGVTASDVGPNYSKVANLFFPIATSSFSGGNQSFNPLFKDPTLGSDTATVTYAFNPVTSGTSSQTLAVTSDSGSISLNLTGSGVGPVASAAPSINFGNVLYGTTSAQALSVNNATTNGNLGNLTNLTLLSATITGPDAARFSLSGFTPGSVLSAGGSLPLSILFDGNGGTLSDYNATLSIVTDQGSAFGTVGQTINIPLFALLVQAPPMTQLSAPSLALRGESVIFTIQGIDQPTLSEPSSFTFTVNWGDGSDVQTVVDVIGPTTLSHQFFATGNYQVSVTTTNSTGTGPATSLGISIVPYLLRADVENPLLFNLLYGGTAGADAVTFTPNGGDGIIIHESALNGIAVDNTFAVNGVTGQLIAYGWKGNDTLDATLMTSAVQLDGGAGNNSVFGGSGNDILFGGTDGAEGRDGNNLVVGGEGDDTVYGNGLVSRKGETGGNNILVGGEGDDTIFGNYSTNAMGDGGEGGQNVIVGGDGADTIYTSQGVDGAEGGHGSIAMAGTTTLDLSGLQAVQSEWTNSTHTLEAKVSNISGTTSSGLNGGTYLQPESTVIDDSSADQVFSDTHGSANWLFVNIAPDVLSRTKSKDVVTEFV
ncbi:LEPR-XLL domain-containing protein [bacterium]|nr:LEPR-XLL domain-containing protein [bacterium]